MQVEVAEVLMEILEQVVVMVAVAQADHQVELAQWEQLTLAAVEAVAEADTLEKMVVQEL
jgi:hypothetical protein